MTDVTYIQDLLREWSNQGVIITLSWDDTRRYFVAIAKYEQGDMLDAHSLTIEGALTELNELCQEWLMEYGD